MNKQNLLKCITDKAYDVGIGAKKHFASYDLLEKTPGFIGFITMAAGVFGLVIDKLAAKEINALVKENFDMITSSRGRADLAAGHLNEIVGSIQKV